MLIQVFGNGRSFSDSKNILNTIIFKDSASAGTLRKYLSLFPGLGPSAGYKVLQRMYKFGGQPFVNDYFTKNHKETFTSMFGEKSAKTMMHATAGRYDTVDLV